MASAEVGAPLVMAGHEAQGALQQGPVDVRVVDRLLVEPQAELLLHRQQLTMHLPPFPNPRGIEEGRLQRRREASAGAALAGFLQPSP